MALVTVLLATALAAVLAVGMTFSQQVEIRRTTNLIENDQALLLAQGLEEWAAQLMITDRQQTSSDNLDEDWAVGLLPVAVDNGFVAGIMEDMQARINVNNLQAADSATAQRAREQLARLFGFCQVEPEGVAALVDWLDGDSNITSPGGAEDNEYLLRAVPYRTANRVLTSVSELRMIGGIDAEQYGCLAPNLAALEPGTGINVNTAGELVIASLAPMMSLETAEEIVRERPEGGYASPAEFLNQPPLAGLVVSPAGLALESDYFLVSGRSGFGQSEIQMYSLLYRGAASVRVVNRSIGTY